MARKGTPSGGYPNKTLHIKAMWNEGLPTAVIAERADTTEQAVTNAIARLRKLGHTDIAEPAWKELDPEIVA